MLPTLNGHGGGESGRATFTGTYAELEELLGDTAAFREALPFWLILVQSGDDTPNQLLCLLNFSTWPRDHPGQPTEWYVLGLDDSDWAASRLIYLISARRLLKTPGFRPGMASTRCTLPAEIRSAGPGEAAGGGEPTKLSRPRAYHDSPG